MRAAWLTKSRPPQTPIFDDGLGTFFVLALLLLTADKLLNINNLWKRPYFDKNGKSIPFYGPKWDKKPA